MAAVCSNAAGTSPPRTAPSQPADFAQCLGLPTRLGRSSQPFGEGTSEDMLQSYCHSRAHTSWHILRPGCDSSPATGTQGGEGELAVGDGGGRGSGVGGAAPGGEVA